MRHLGMIGALYGNRNGFSRCYEARWTSPLRVVSALVPFRKDLQEEGAR